MSSELISHSPDLKRLRDEGFQIEARNGLLLVHQIPYLDSSLVTRWGILVSTLILAGNRTDKPDTHVIYFNGDFPCNRDGSAIEQLRNQDETKEIAEGVVINHTFSCKPPEGYTDYYQKICMYTEIITGPVKSIDSTITERTFVAFDPDDENQIFKYHDTNSARAGIIAIGAKLRNQKIAIIGVGGTGSYILDFVAKTEVKEIHLFDGDDFLQHNAFRAPGAPPLETLIEKQNKARYFDSIYSAMRYGICVHAEDITEKNVDQLSTMNFVFICIDDNKAKRIVLDKLNEVGISYIDVGMGILNVDDSLLGIVRMTASTKEKRDHIKNSISLDGEEKDDYSTNIQIAELNALNASLAVIKWKKMNGLFYDFGKENTTLYTLSTGELINEDTA